MKELLPYDFLFIISFLLVVFTTIVSCFWFIYLIETIRRKWNIYRRALGCLQQGDCDLQQQILTYNSKTEFVKNVFLFFMNLVEWTGIMLACILIVPTYIDYIKNPTHKNQSMIILGHSIYDYFPSNNSGTLFLDSSSFPYLGNISFVLSIILIASLCMYLAARYAQKSWIKSDKIPFMIGVFLVGEILTEIAASFCYTHVIAMWCDKFLLTASLIIAFQQYRKLIMIINWLIVDLKICNNRTLLRRQIRMKRNFTRILRLFLVGSALVIMSEYLESILLTSFIILRENEHSSFYKHISLCGVSHFSNPDVGYIFIIIAWIKMILALVGLYFILIPYIGYSLLAMCTILWRLCKGKTGYKTHFRNPLFAPLIREKK